MKDLSFLSGIEHSLEKEDLLCYSYDASYADAQPPLAVVWPRKTDEVARVLRCSGERGLSVIPRGAGTGMAGATVPRESESIVVSLEKMRKMIEVDTRNMTVMVEPGFVNGRLQEELEALGYFYPPDPASMQTCTIGGNVATNAGGPRALKYGVTRDYVMGLEVVLADGTILTLGGRTYKRTVGYDLRNLVIGSEGTLAVITKIRLRMLPLPEEVLTLLVLFKDLAACGEAALKILSSRVMPRTMEFLDRSSIEAVEQYKPTGLPTDLEALLLIELDGYAATIRREAERVVDICRGGGGEAVIAEEELARRRLWEARRSLSPALYQIKPNKINQDIVVPRPMITELLLRLRTLSEESGVRIVNFGHAGDGNMHANIMVDAGDPDEYARGLELVGKVYRIALDLGGSISGEHGIGILKAPYVAMELKETELALMKHIKAGFDPKGILNPGKIFEQGTVAARSHGGGAPAAGT
jgi:glycolate oxidase